MNRTAPFAISNRTVSAGSSIAISTTIVRILPPNERCAYLARSLSNLARTFPNSPFFCLWRDQDKALRPPSAGCAAGGIIEELLCVSISAFDETPEDGIRDGSNIQASRETTYKAILRQRETHIAV